MITHHTRCDATCGALRDAETSLHERGELVIRGHALGALIFTHADGRAYGAPSAHVYAEPSPADLRADALSALTNLGFRGADAKAAELRPKR